MSLSIFFIPSLIIFNSKYFYHVKSKIYSQTLRKYCFFFFFSTYKKYIFFVCNKQKVLRKYTVYRIDNRILNDVQFKVIFYINVNNSYPVFIISLYFLKFSQNFCIIHTNTNSVQEFILFDNSCFERQIVNLFRLQQNNNKHVLGSY